MEKLDWGTYRNSFNQFENRFYATIRLVNIKMPQVIIVSSPQLHLPEAGLVNDKSVS